MTDRRDGAAMLTRRTICQAMAVAPLAIAAGRAGAQAHYPGKPVRFVLPFGAGGVADVTSRLAAEKLGEKLGQRFVVENQPGAGGINAARTVTSATADGYTLGLVTNGTAISVPLFKALPFDPTKDFTLISALGTSDLVFVVNAQSKTVDDGTVTYKQVVELAYPGGTANPDLMFDVDFENAASKPRAGSLVDGHSVEVKRHGTEFSVIRSVRS